MSTENKMHLQKNFIQGLEIGGYRSFKESQRIGPFGRLNVFVGQNNSGKSNVLRFIHDWYHEFFRSAQNNFRVFTLAGFPPEDKHGLSMNTKVKVGIGLSRSAIDESSVNWCQEPEKKLFDFLTEDGILYATWEGTTKQGLNIEFGIDSNTLDWIPGELGHFITNFRDEIGLKGTPETTIPGRVFSYFIEPLVKKLEIARIEYIPDVRSIGTKKKFIDGEQSVGVKPDKRELWNGQFAIDALAMLQNPGKKSMTSADLKRDKEKFLQINKFFREVTGLPDSSIQANYEKDTLIVDVPPEAYPLENLGRGLHEVIMMAIACTAFDNCIWCIEEPELHMHPTLQRQLISYLLNQTENQYFISTHSPTFIDVEGATVFSVSHKGGGSTVRLIIDGQDKFLSCRDLGVRASDLMQSNCLIWVEGPSDAIYVRHWLSDTGLIEGRHFSIMFYGGALRRHVTSSKSKSGNDALEDLISLLNINRNVVMIADSDKKKRTDAICKEKQRLKREVIACGGLSLITEGRTIENYLLPSSLDAARKKVHPKTKFPNSMTKFSDVMYYAGAGKKNKNRRVSVDKVRFASVVADIDDAYRKDMGLQTFKRELVLFIETCNSIESTK